MPVTKRKPQKEKRMPLALAVRQPGYEGAYFAEEKVRDFEGSKNGRELVRRIRYDVIERLYRYNPPLLDLHQRDAAVKLQCDWQLSETPVMARVGTLGTGKANFGLSEAVLDATGRVRACKSSVGVQWPIIEAIVLTNLNLTKAATAFGIDRLRVLSKLRTALDHLSDFYGTR